MQSEWWRGDGWPTPEEWNALFVGLTFAVALVAAFVALVQYHAHVAAERARTRPYVIVDYSFRSILMQIEIKNIGTSAATDVHLSVSPPFESGLRDQAKRLNAVFSPNESISMLAPGRRILYTFDRAPDYHAQKRPEKYTITATYRDLPPRHTRTWYMPWRTADVKYVDSFPLDFRQWSQATTETDYDDKNWNIANRGEQREKKIVSALESIAKSLSQREAAPTDEWVLDTVEDGEIVNDYVIEHPGPEQPRAIDSDTALGARRGGITSRGPRARWIRR